MGPWDLCMLLQTPSTSVPVMVSTVLFPGGGQNFAVWFSLPSLSSGSQGLTPREAGTSPLVQWKARHQEQSGLCVWRLFVYADLVGLRSVDWDGRPRAWCPSCGGVEPRACASASAEGQRPKAMSELAAQAGRWGLEAKMGDCGCGGEDKKHGHGVMGGRLCRRQGCICSGCQLSTDVAATLVAGAQI